MPSTTEPTCNCLDAHRLAARIEIEAFVERLAALLDQRLKAAAAQGSEHRQAPFGPGDVASALRQSLSLPVPPPTPHRRR